MDHVYGTKHHLEVAVVQGETLMHAPHATAALTF